jgi:hypothetical protein
MSKKEIKDNYENDNSNLNFYELKQVKKHEGKKIKNPYFKNTHMKVPCRCLILGCTGSGKSITLLNYIRRTPLFTKIIICHKLDETLYNYLQEEINDPEKLIFYKSIDDLPDFNELKETLMPEDNVMLILDDIVNNKDQRKIEDYMLLGRKVGNGISIFYLAQSFFKCPIFIRQQIDYLIIVKVNSIRNLNQILKEMSFISDAQLLKDMYDISTKEKFGFLKVDIYNGDENKKFTKNWIQFFEIN